MKTVQVPPDIQRDFQLRRSPRKHPASVVVPPPGFKTMAAPGYTTLKIAGNVIVPNGGVPSPQPSSLSRQNSFTMLDPASGIPSDGTSRLAASLTPLNSALFPYVSPVVMPSAAFRFNKQPKPAAKIKEEVISGKQCPCFGQPRVCGICSSRKSQRTPRSGTAGFRPPEVLLKTDNQTTAVDVWAAGTVMLSLMARSYPFFRAPDDITALAELTAVFGTEPIRETAERYGKQLTVSHFRPVGDLHGICLELSYRTQKRPDPNYPDPLPSLARPVSVDLVRRLLGLHHSDRITAEEALKHPFFDKDSVKGC